MLLLLVIIFTSVACYEYDRVLDIQGCKGDFNASYTDCPIACPSTCAKPNAEYCGVGCGEPGCECNPGYLLNKINGTCIKAEDCPNQVCGPDEVFRDCLIKCPNIYCPVFDVEVACDPARPCPSGCGCRDNYLRRSVNEYVCIPASKCPSIKCRGPNEVWNPCTGACFSDYCLPINYQIVACSPPDPDYCKPRCVCKKGCYRNSNNTCVTAAICYGKG